MELWFLEEEADEIIIYSFELNLIQKNKISI